MDLEKIYQSAKTLDSNFHDTNEQQNIIKII